MVEVGSCTNCSRYKLCTNTYVNPDGLPKVKMLIVLDSPTALDDSYGTIGESSSILSTVLYEVVGIPKDEVAITYAVKCFTPKDPTAKEINACGDHLANDIWSAEPTVVLTMGELSMTMLTGNKGIAKYKGITQPIVYCNTRAVLQAVQSPEYIDKNMSNLESWANYILKAWNLANGVDEAGLTRVVSCDTEAKVDQLIKYVKQTGVCSYDFETPKVDEKLQTFAKGFYATTLSISFQVGSAWVIPIEHEHSPFDKSQIKSIMAKLRDEVFYNPEVRKIGHNLAYDFHICRIYGIVKMLGRIDDTMLMHHLHNEDERSGLKELVSVYFPEFAGYEDKIAGIAWDKVPLRSLMQYNGTDTDMTLRLCILLESYLQQDKPSYIIYRNLTMAAFRPLWEAEAMGMQVDSEYLRKAIEEVDGYISDQIKKLHNNKYVKRYNLAKMDELRDNKLAELRAKLEDWRSSHPNPTKTEQNMVDKINGIKSGSIVIFEGINFSSPKQMQDILYFSPYGFKFKSIDKGTGKDILEALESQDDTGFIKDLLLLRSMEKMQGTYLRGIYERLDDDGRVHTNFKLNGTESGRLSSRNPNLQNLPNAYKLDNELAVSIVKKVKKSFVPPKDHTLIQIDYAQAELRIIASFAKEANMIDVYLANKDIHALTASNVMRIPLDQFYTLDKGEQKLKRFQAKAVNFGFIYGMSSEGFKTYAATDYKLNYTSREAEDIRSVFFQTYPSLLDYHKTYEAKARNFGWVRTLFGRRRRTPDVNSRDQSRASSDARIAVNSPIQGTGGELTVFSIALMYNRLPKHWKFINTIHDSIMFYIPTNEVQQAIEAIRFTCENLPTMQYFGKELYKVGMKVDAEGSTQSWADLSDI